MVSLSILLPASKNPIMLTFARHPRRSVSNRKLRTWWAAEVSSDRASWRDLQRAGSTMGGLERVIVPPRPRVTWLRLRAQSRGAPAELSSVGLYELDRGTGDVWLAVGASIQADAMDHVEFKLLLQERHGADPVLFNRAVPGWTSQNLREALPRLLEEFSEVKYVAIHIGGNNVSHSRPYPGGAARLRADLIAIVDMVQAAGKQPVLARLSYRRYRTRPVVGRESLGSGPYVESIYDPIIETAMPRFFDHGRGVGAVDPYGWYRSNPRELGSDGVHLNAAGRRSWTRIWVDGVGPAVYGLAPQ